MSAGYLEHGLESEGGIEHYGGGLEEYSGHGGDDHQDYYVC